jgi:acetyl-CoA carboxylase biotin carboxyl carrier protein
MSEASSRDIDAIVALFQQSSWKEMRLTYGSTELFLSKDSNASFHVLGGAAPTEPTLPSGHRASVPARPVPQADPPPSATSGQIPDGWTVVRAPSLGTFYRAPKPGAQPFCSEGDAIGCDDELCLIEVMKLFTTVRAGVSGTVREIYAKDGDMVEFDQPLFLVEPHA